MSEFLSGVLLDDRSPAEKAKDYKFEELVSSTAQVDWKATKKLRQFPIYSQNGSGSCVAQSAAKMLGINYHNIYGNYVHFSATDIYQRRANRPNGGMNGVDCFQICQKGVTLEDLSPSQNMTDAQMDNMPIDEFKREVGKLFKTENYVVVENRDIDTIASIIQQTSKGVMVWFYFNHDEWNSEKPVIKRKVDLYAQKTSRHSVVATDFLLIDGKKYLQIEDSWGPGTGKGGRRFISEDFMSRCWFAGYFVNFKFQDMSAVDPAKPAFKWTGTLRQGHKNEQVRNLQKVLQHHGFFPRNVDTTGFFGAVTKSAVIKLQSKFGLSPDGVVGPVTGKQVEKL